MEEWILAHEPLVRLGSFVLVLAVFGALEALFPRRRLTTLKATRWGRNIALTALDAVTVRGIAALVPIAAVATALATEKQGFGLLRAVAMPRWASLVFAIVALDFVIYIQHVLFHAVPALWRLHEVHHADLDIDVTTGARFHPVEIVLSMGIKSAAVYVLGAAAADVIIFEVLLNATAMFNHSNLRLPPRADRVVRWLLVTPDMHRVHHSVVREELNTNFGFNLPWWDRLLGTYRDQPSAGHEGMTIGVERLRDDRALTFARLIALPLKRTSE